MDDVQPDNSLIVGPKPFPKAQAYLLLGILIGYPLLSIGLSMIGSTDPSRITAKISQVYLPSLMVQVILLSIVTIVLKQTDTPFADIGIGRGDFTWSNIISGIIFFIGAWSMIILVRLAIEKSGYFPEKDFMFLLPKTSGEKAFWLLLSIGAAFSEEITFRGFTISRLKLFTGNYWVGAIISSAAFGIGHLYQGMAGVVTTFIYGLLFAGLYIARRSVFPCIVAHFLQDALVLLALAR
jgi:membrane protease YdiL (CAAX protease family)